MMGKIPDGQGYGIRKKYTFAKVNNKDLYEIVSNISKSSKSDETSIRNRLQDTGIKPRNLLELDFASAVRAGIGNNVMGNDESRGRRNYIESDTSGFDSRKDKGENEIGYCAGVRSGVRKGIKQKKDVFRHLL